ncbi:ATP-binding protein [Paracoccus sp. (in: a-proteobacteria)]|uniref:ATP-binding protein n=1 Tax=Paracoccus sp. TaxID=267 RepID=UPI0035B21C07
MTRHQTISSAALQARALDLAGRHAIGLLASGSAAPLAPALDELSAFGPVALLRMLQRFGLSPLETDLFCLIAAPELGIEAAAALAAHPLSQQGLATPALCRMVLGAETGPMLSAGALLRQAALVEALPGPSLAQRPLVLPEAVASALIGAPMPDPALAPALSPSLAATHPQAGMLAEALIRARSDPAAPILHLACADPAEAAAAASGAAAGLGLHLAALEPQLLAPGLDPARAAQLLNRDAVLTETAFLIPATSEGCLIADRLQAPCLIWGIAPQRTQRPRASWAPARATPLPRAELQDAKASHAIGLAPDLPALLRERAAQGLDGLAQRIEPQARWDDLVLPAAQLAQLRQLAQCRRLGAQVLDNWGFRAKSARGLALTALFSGPSGTGKTMAAEILARELCDEVGDSGALALYRVDLAAMVSKYIGETQKNIGRIFDAAEDSGAVLLFDEGEALFARRSPEVKDSHDRHANSETSYLLQRLETYSGIAIVTTNLRAAVDDAFLRRFRAVIDFPFPDAAQRALIWQAVLPPALPREGIDFDALARLTVSGGFIRAIALTAAWLAAADGAVLRMAHLERAARQEYMKLGKPLSESELRGFR